MPATRRLLLRIRHVVEALAAEGRWGNLALRYKEQGTASLHGQIRDVDE